MSKLAKTLSAMGSVVLLVTAGFHSTALPQASEAANAEDAHPLVAMTFDGIWLMPSISWTFIAILSLYLAFGKMQSSRFVLLLLTLIPLVHAALILKYTGPFIGAYMLIAAWAFLLAGAAFTTKPDL